MAARRPLLSVVWWGEIRRGKTTLPVQAPACVAHGHAVLDIQARTGNLRGGLQQCYLC
jgi:hypothetical protein